jgi:pimeloyl-ACP methyl ester carboxylesterase
MERRAFVSGAAFASAGAAIGAGVTGGLASRWRRGGGPIHYELHGNPTGPKLFLAFPIFASYGEIFGAGAAPVLSGFLDRLTDRYRVMVVDYPNVGKTFVPAPGEMTADRVAADLLGVASEAGFDRFAYWGYAWGAAVGLQIASRTDRLTALVCGGWTPLGGQYAEMLAAARASVPNPSPSSMKVLRDQSQYTQWVTFYSSVLEWPEAESVARIRCPRMAFAGAESNAIVPYAATLRARKKELEAMGWYVTEIPGRGHDVGLDPAAVVPVVREFLDKAI